MKKQLNYLFVLLLIIVIAYLFSPSKVHTDKLWVLKGVSLADPYKAAVIEYWHRKKAFPQSDELALEKIKVIVNFNKTAVGNISVGESGPGTITIHFRTPEIESAPEALNMTKIILTPDVMGNKFVWMCKGTMPESLLPTGCK